jgi:hypothetical protein
MPYRAPWARWPGRVPAVVGCRLIMGGMENVTPSEAPTLTVVWRLPVGVASMLTYLCRQFRWYPSESDAAAAALRRALDQEALP